MGGSANRRAVLKESGEPMPSANANRNLLFGILALQMDFIERDALVGVMNA
jgi:hypothetical protein